MAMSQSDQATYANGVSRAATFQPLRSNGPTNSSAHTTSAPPIRIPMTPIQAGTVVDWIAATPVSSVQTPVRLYPRCSPTATPR